LIPIIKITDKCNLNCEYCYRHFDTTQESDIGVSTILNIMNFLNITTNSNPGRIILHGGEPLVLPDEFFLFFLYLQKKFFPNKSIFNAIQTNATLLSESRISFLHSLGYNLGVSFDGLPSLTNSQRPLKNKGKLTSSELILKSIQNLAFTKRGTSAIIVVTESVCEKIIEVYNFCKELNIGLKFNPLVPSLKGNSALTKSNLFEDYGTRLCELFDIWVTDKTPVIVEPFDSMIAAILGGKSNQCSFSASCQQSFISIHQQGNVYPCNRFTSQDDLCYGNVNKDTVESIMEHSNRKLFLNRIQNLTECQSCKYWGWRVSIHCITSAWDYFKA